MPRIVMLLMLLRLVVSLGACVVEAGPGLGPPGAHWVPGHYGPYGGWVPGHRAP